MSKEPDWFVKQQKANLIKQTNDIIKRANRWIWINLGVGTFDAIYAIWIDIIIFKVFMAMLAIFMFYMMYTHYKTKKRGEAILLEIEKVIPDKEGFRT